MKMNTTDDKILLYQSESQVRETELTVVISNILETSNRNNKRDGITGILIYDNDCWFQVLEGSKENVDNCFSRIESDNRHDNIRVLIDEPSKKKQFERWSMGFADPFELKDFLKISLMLHTGSPAEILNEMVKIGKERWIVQCDNTFSKY